MYKQKWAHQILKISFITFIFSFSFKINAAYYDLGLNYSYQSQLYGNNRRNSVISKTYSGSITIYLFQLLGIEVNYSHSNEITSQPFDESNNYSVGYKNQMSSNIYGLGLRQSFSSRNALIRPSLSLGYARQISESSSTFTFWNSTSAAREKIVESLPRTDHHSVFATFTLQLKLTPTLRLQGSVKTIFEAFEFNRAKDNLKYLVGFSWFF